MLDQSHKDMGVVDGGLWEEYGHRSGYTILRGHDHGKFQADTIIGNVAMSVFLQAASWEML